MNRQAQSAVLFVLGAALLHAGLTDLYLRYVKAGLRPLVLAAGVVLIATALATAWYEWRARAKEEEHAHREPRVSWLLVLPLFALILVAPPALGSYSAMRTGTALQQSYGYAKLPQSGPCGSASPTTRAAPSTSTAGDSRDGRSSSPGSSPWTTPARPTWSAWPSTAVRRTPSRSRSG